MNDQASSAADRRFSGRRLTFGALLAGAVLTGGTALTARLFGVEASFQSVADQVTILLPPRIFAFLLFHLQHWAKPLLLLGLASAWTALGAALALLAWRISWRVQGAARWAISPAMAVSAAIWLLSIAVISPLAGDGFAGSNTSGGALRWSLAALLPVLLYGLIVKVRFPFAGRTEAEQKAEPPLLPQSFTRSGVRELSRRELLIWAGGGIVAVAGAVTLVKDLLDLSRGTAQGGSTQAAGGAVLPGAPKLEPEVTPAGQFYVVSKNFLDPAVDAGRWRLKVGGAVDHPYELSYADVIALTSRDQHVTLECISNEIGGDQIGNALWTGVPLAVAIERAAPQADIAFVLTRSEDGYAESLPMGVAMDPDSLLAYQMNGAPLLREHGFPLRLLIPGRYGMKSTKWLTEIELSEKDRPGYWEARGWDEAALVKTMSRIDFPPNAWRLPNGPVTVAGIAYAGSRGIQRVEVSADNGATWRQAAQEPALSKYSWVRWSIVWQPPAPGSYRLLVRATDMTGQVQTSVAADDYPDGASGYHAVSLRIV